MFGDFFGCKVFIVPISAFDFVEVFLREIFFHFSFTVRPIKLLADDSADWVHLSGLGSGSGTRLSGIDGGFTDLIYCCTLGSLQTGCFGGDSK